MQKNINLQDLPQQKLRDLLEFPCDFTFKVMGVHREGLVEDIVSVAQVHVKGDYLPREQRSSKGTYNSVSIDILAENIEQTSRIGYLFSKKGLIIVNQADEDALMEAAIEAGADDVQPQDDGSFEIYTAWEELGSVRDGIEAAGFKVQEAEVTMIPSTTVDLDAETAPKLLRLIDMLEDCDDVQNVYHNGEISDEVAAML